MTMKGEPVPPEGLDHIKSLQKWLEQYPNDVMVRSKLAEIQRDPRFAEPDEPDDIMPQVPELAEFPVPPGLKKYIEGRPHRRRGQCPHIGCLHRRHIQPPGCRRYRRSEQGQRSASIRPVLCRRLGERLEEERVVPGNHEGPRGGRRTGGRPAP